MSSTQFAQDLAPGADIDWNRLERAAYSGHPEIQSLLDASAQDFGEHPGRGRTGSDLLMVLLQFWPLVAVGLIVIPIRLDADPFVPALIAAIGAVGYICSQWYWLRPGAEASIRVVLLSIAEAVLGILGVVVFAIVAPHVTAGGLLLAIFVLMTVVSLITAVVVLVRGRRSGGSAPTVPVRAVRAAIDALPAPTQESIRGDLSAALVNLQARGAITEAARVRLAAAPLGTLARTHAVSAEADARKADR
ncbi:hypothetical protein [Microbacterium hibisci]|uniref:hypothetical protein n=1 Tax=Microbacterium hibisci TaxID=2036000 RepID=UPI0019415726|nr:hypothetical protein [Microbacterium hibisci]